jgi:hypothetical protein
MVSRERRDLLLGALVGGSVVAALIAGVFGLLAIGQQGQQATAGFLREERRVAYAAVLSEYQDFYMSANKAFAYASAVDNGERPLVVDEFDELATKVASELDESSAAVVTVRLIGSERAAELSSALLFEMDFVGRFVDTTNTQLHRVSPEVEPKAAIAALTGSFPPIDLQDDVQHFLEQAREDLGAK